MKRTARVGNCLQWRTQDSNQESLALESEEDFSSSDESGEDSEEERLYFEKRIDPKEDFCNSTAAYSTGVYRVEDRESSSKGDFLQTSSELVNLEKKECCIADETGKIRLLLYDDQILRVLLGHSYDFSCISTRSQGGLHLTTRWSTTIEEIPTIEVPEEFSCSEAPAEVQWWLVLKN
ncbi:hypothetical protein MHYP_G00364310 [Metynnis hypsauchen]